MTLLTFASTEATLEAAGGKGANLARLTRAGFAVPRGFIIPTAAYRQFVACNALDRAIEAALADLTEATPAALDAASGAIRRAFAQGSMPPDLGAEILSAYAALSDSPAAIANRKSEIKNHELPVAVRSSATAEDLPDLSFAGQQDTYLNVIGADQLLQAVVNCWSSLWTARAIGYRRRNAIPHTGAALAVIVQEMVPSECAGVLFTANPLSGLLCETVIDAAFGLGEALVSGQVEPDHCVYDVRAGRLVEHKLGAKQVATRARAGGGVETVPQTDAPRPALDGEQVRTLAEIGQRIQAEYGAPQDIEWAIVGGQVHVLQSRAITSLFPVPAVSFDPLRIWLSFGSVQGIKGPLTRLGRDAILHVLSGIGPIAHVRLQPHAGNFPIKEAGERLWIEIGGLLRHPLIGRAVLNNAEIIDPGFGGILAGLARDPRLGIGQGRTSLRTNLKIARAALPLMARVVGGMLRPRPDGGALEAAFAQFVSSGDIAAGADRYERLANITAYLSNRVGAVLPALVKPFLRRLGPAMVSFLALRRVAGSSHRDLVLEITRGLPGNVTTEMDLALWEAARAICADADSLCLFETAAATDLAQRASDGALPAAGQAAVDRFLAAYGMRGFVEFDLGRPRWREDPTPVMQSLKSYVQIDPHLAPDVLHARGAQSAEAAIEKLAAAVRPQRGGRMKARLVRGLARRVRLGLGLRESPKFAIIRILSGVRATLLVAGQEFVTAGTLNRPDDLFFFTLADLAALAQRDERDWRALVAARRVAYEREQRRGQDPRVLVSDGRAFYEGVGAATDTEDALTGSPVSPGMAEGRVRIVLDPHHAQLQPGEILVCPGTDPAWTPLFLVAGGLVTEVGGMMTHGSVVAREVGIPAVVGVHLATERLKTGQLIRIDGSSGRILVLDEAH